MKDENYEEKEKRETSCDRSWTAFWYKMGIM